MAPPQHATNVNTMERLASKLGAAAQHVKVSVGVEREARLRHQEAETKHEETMESIYREFRRCETDRVSGLRDSIRVVMKSGVQKFVDRSSLSVVESWKSVRSIDLIIDLYIFN